MNRYRRTSLDRPESCLVGLTLLNTKIADGTQNLKPYPHFFKTKVLQAASQNTIGVACNLLIPHAKLHAASNFEQIENCSEHSATKQKKGLCGG